MAEPRRGLGRGLSALLGETGGETALDAPAVAAALPGAPAHETPIELLRRNPDQPRRTFGEAELEELTASIREKGLLQPILVRPAPGAPGEFQIVAGERRWRAAQRAGLHTVPVLVRELDDLDVLEIGIVENVQRADLSPLEEALGYKALIERFGRTQEQVAQVVGKSRSHVANALRLLNMPEEVQAHIAEGRLSAGHARAIATAPDPAGLARAIVDKGLSVRQAEALSRQAQDRPAPSQPKAAAPSRKRKHPDTVALENDLSDALGLEVELDFDEGRGVLTIRYETLEQLDDVCQRLTGGYVKG